MPRRELKYPSQVESWLASWGARLSAPGEMILIGSGALLWHAAQRGIETPLPADLLAPKLVRGEPRDVAHADWARRAGLW